MTKEWNVLDIGRWIGRLPGWWIGMGPHESFSLAMGHELESCGNSWPVTETLEASIPWAGKWTEHGTHLTGSWGTGRPGVLQSMGWQRVRHSWATEHWWHRVVTRLKELSHGKQHSAGHTESTQGRLSLCKIAASIGNQVEGGLQRWKGSLVNRVKGGLLSAGCEVYQIVLWHGRSGSMRKSSRQIPTDAQWSGADVPTCPGQGHMRGAGGEVREQVMVHTLKGHSHLIPVPITRCMPLPWWGVAWKSSAGVHSGARPAWGPLQEAARTERAGGKAKLGVSCELQVWGNWNPSSRPKGKRKTGPEREHTASGAGVARDKVQWEAGKPWAKFLTNKRSGLPGNPLG